jgi:type IV pilus assembly protein PilM
MWNKSVSLYIDDTSIRLLVVKRQRVRIWADLNLEPGLVKDSVVVQEAEVSRRIKKLFQAYKVRAKKVFLGFSGLHSLTRPAVLPEMPANMLAEAITREARRVLPVPLDQLYLSWSYLPSAKPRIKVVIVGVPRKTVDSLVKTIRAAGLEPRWMGIKPLILTRMLPVNTAIFVDAQPKEFDIVLILDGVPQPIRTVSFPEHELTTDARLEMIISDFDRTIKFYDANNPDKPLNLTVPIYVSGEITGNSELQAVLARATGHPVIPLNNSLKGSEKIDAGRFMVNMALAVRNPASATETTFKALNLNLLPAPYQPKPISLTRVIGIPGSAAAVALVVPVMVLLQSTAANIDAIQAQLETTNQITHQRTVQKQEYNKVIIGLTKQAAEAKLAYNGLANSINSLKTGQETINGNLSLVLKVLPPGVTLTRINESMDTLIIEGESNNEADLLKYARDLDKSGRYSQTIISSLGIIPAVKEKVEKGGNISFTLTLICKE